MRRTAPSLLNVVETERGKIPIAGEIKKCASSVFCAGFVRPPGALVDIGGSDHVESRGCDNCRGLERPPPRHLRGHPRQRDGPVAAAIVDRRI
jgi:hypothetical protein